MTQEEKDLLLKDLCARLPHKVIVEFVSYEGEEKPWIGELSCKDLDCFIHDVGFIEIKPYLFPLSSMTGEQRKEYEWIIHRNIELHCERYYNVIDIDDFDCLMDFYHKNHLDYRGLIPMGLANDATNINIY